MRVHFIRYPCGTLPGNQVVPNYFNRLDCFTRQVNSACQVVDLLAKRTICHVAV
jgi:hypothetical protein